MNNFLYIYASTNQEFELNLIDYITWSWILIWWKHLKLLWLIIGWSVKIWIFLNKASLPNHAILYSVFIIFTLIFVQLNLYMKVCLLTFLSTANAWKFTCIYFFLFLSNSGCEAERRSCCTRWFTFPDSVFEVCFKNICLQVFLVFGLGAGLWFLFVLPYNWIVEEW